jgi:TrmH family RNA methyltransferase
VHDSRIQSGQNERLKRAARLRTHRGRTQQRRIIVDGRREVLRALQGGIEPHELFISEDHLADPGISPITEEAAARSLRTFYVAAPAFAKIAYGNRTEGVVLVAEQPERRLSDFQPAANPLICVVERVEKPGNVGAILRTADAAGVSAVIVADGITDLYNHNAIRASLGAIFHVPLFAASAADTLEFLHRLQCSTYAAQVDASRPYTDVDYRGPTAVVLGSEAEGLSAIWRGENVTPVALPMRGVVDSLNVSATAAILCYEALRQRGASA